MHEQDYDVYRPARLRVHATENDDVSCFPTPHYTLELPLNIDLVSVRLFHPCINIAIDFEHYKAFGKGHRVLDQKMLWISQVRKH